MGYHGDYGKYSGGIRIMMKYARLKRENGDESMNLWVPCFHITCKTPCVRLNCDFVEP